MRDPETVLAFWYEELSPKDWFRKNPAIDRTIETRFSALHQQASRGECYWWRSSPRGRLAEIIVLDQFSRNIYRDDARAFAQDGMALTLAQWAIASGADTPLTPAERQFLYMPFMHSESSAIHEVAGVLFSSSGLEDALRSEQQHRGIIQRFGRYPHRNAVLRRPSTPEEIEFLKGPGSGF
ncbi:conserved hypothetical protein [Luminiphilus syltensis NOR5-1B]|uniref:DUF924 domain-containing protein n=1 Tax=Luminiphilus syltensis NOR5-1B TaxID=565045 RepID=B8KYE7_9GAMM|nr:DUF924 family protein [Luminiphilus syltensis]EED34799.1 conserved hypothetical protein [Luminiphilus syltensis NOR5-1B]